MGTGHIEMCERPQEERRRCARLTCSRFACSCTVKPESGYPSAADIEKKLGALLLNICVNGACFETNFEPARGTDMRLKVRPIIGPEMTARIKVLHTRPSATSGFYVIGSEFRELGEQDRQNLLTLLLTIGQMEEDLAGE